MIAVETWTQFRNQFKSSSLCAGPAIDAPTFSLLRRRAMLDGCKWDPQVGDLATLAPFPIVMAAAEWNHLATQAEQLADEAYAAEEEIVRRPELIRVLGLPRKLEKVLQDESRPTPGAGRVMRFDFHPTVNGWRISEVNSDVPGGFSEASTFTMLVAEQFPDLRPPGNPAAVWSQALAIAAGSGGRIALLSATGYMEDHQVIAFLAEQLDRIGCQTHLANPCQIIWHDGQANLETSWHRGPVDLIVRFYQAEWLSRLPDKTGWRNFFRSGKTCVANPASAVISESKRFPLTWDELYTSLPTWRALLPETCDPRRAPWRDDDGWLLKTAMCNTGDTVSIREFMPPKDWWWTQFSVSVQPRNWIAQRRFQSVPITTPAGSRHVCVGVYVVNGRAAGAYIRLSATPVIDFAAMDAALLIQDE